MPDLLGPADAPFAVSVRPADARVFPAGDTFFKDCTAPGAGDGTRISAAYQNGLLLQLRRAIRGMGVTEDNADDDMLLKAIQAIANVSVPVLSARARMPIYPMATAASGLLGVTGATGEVVVSAGNTFVHRGVFLISTDDYLLAARTFVTAASKTYHLRWRWNAGVPAFVLLDLADVAYNPAADVETHVKFDSTYDDMLIARVVTSGANAPTITALANFDRPRLRFQEDKIFLAVPASNPGPHSLGSVIPVNWARTPRFVIAKAGTFGPAGQAMGGGFDIGLGASPLGSISRYSAQFCLQVFNTRAEPNDITLQYEVEAYT